MLLAIVVVIEHCGGISYINSVTAIQSFFIISGFYMSLIINEKYNQPKSYKLFISNRFLRLFPIYICIVIITLVVAYLYNSAGYKQVIFSDFKGLTLFSKIYVIFINLFIVGQDTSLFFGLDAHGALHYVKHYTESVPPLWNFLLCPPAWSMSLELMFYAIAPFIIKRKLSVIITIMALVFILRIVIYTHGMHYDPWTYRFFITELFFFLSGNLGYRIYNYIRKMEIARKLGFWALISLVLFLFTFNYLPVIYYVKQYVFYAFLSLAIPFIFLYTKNFKIDRFLGELSYPLYVSHYSIIIFFLPVVYHFFSYSSGLQVPLAIIFSIIFSYLLVQWVGRPIDNMREKRVEEYNRH